MRQSRVGRQAPFQMKGEDKGMKKVFVKSYGCQMNAYDSERMIESLAAMQYRQVDEPEQADMVILNTCHIREKAAEKLFSDLGRFYQMKQARQKAGQQSILTVAGCVAQAEGEEIQRRAPYVDIVVGPQAYHRLPEMIRHYQESAAVPTLGKKTALDTSFPLESKFDHLPQHRLGKGVVAFLTVQEGCDKFCTFCVVPYTRGGEVSRPVQSILVEAKDLVKGGAKEIILLGQNVNAYHGLAPSGIATWGLARLLLELAEIDGLQRLRYITSHPLDMGDDLIQAHGQISMLMPYLHLPVQSGSDKILKQMNRRHNTADYEKVIDKIRSVRPGLALSSDFIVGFPGETQKDFEETLSFIKKITYAQAYSFKYSPRPGTPAANHDQQISEELKDQRLQELQFLLDQQQYQFNQQMVGQELMVLLEKKSRQPHQVHGRSPHMQLVHVEASEDLIGQMVRVRVDQANSHSLGGKLVSYPHREGAHHA